jgi:hypothetical protein
LQLSPSPSLLFHLLSPHTVEEINILILIQVMQLMKNMMVFGSFWLVPDPNPEPEFTSGRSRIRNKSFGSATLLQTNEQDRIKRKNCFCAVVGTVSVPLLHSLLDNTGNVSTFHTKKRKTKREERKLAFMLLYLGRWRVGQEKKWWFLHIFVPLWSNILYFPTTCSAALDVWLNCMANEHLKSSSHSLHYLSYLLFVRSTAWKKAFF